MAKKLYKGNEAVAEAAIQAGCRYFFGYPITPQNEIPEYMARRMPKVGGTFLQAESEVAAINMVYGAGGSGARVMTSSSSPGVSLKQEGISYIAGAEVPCVIVNMVRGGPGLGSIQPAQSDYFQATKGGGHGDYHLVVYAPGGIQEAVDLTMKAFDTADLYRMPVMILGDGMIGQMMEPAEIPEDYQPIVTDKSWATTGGGRRVINSLYIQPDELERVNLRLQKKYALIKEKETMYDEYLTEDAELIFAAYGTTARICQSAINMLRADGVKAGLIRPITLWPFPDAPFAAAAARDGVKKFLTVEMSCGQMIEDVKLSVGGRKEVAFYGRTGGMIPMPRDVYHYALSVMR
ncbi:MAG: 3-methyl-2-oxobutanoate dehydrogenase subunit VorB [Eubacteriales bacterium]|nr:3-methyl-2-oxobutanoate dehydrogenase subunit VorB [Eubacteriales bacterium]